MEPVSYTHLATVEDLLAAAKAKGEPPFLVLSLSLIHISGGE